mmetsp:Transcript_41740/g.116369  ORF Transcript_41740/g.116369 Transcript_41740/m.116369 type:complete len:218 (-) Transcript_41740:759-1412(-)
MISSFIFSIACKTFVNGFPTLTRAKMRMSLVDFRERRACRKARATRSRVSACAFLSRLALACRCTVDNCSRNPVAPSRVAVTFPNALKAWSLSRMAMASATAASSFARNILRLSYSFSFSAHIGPSAAKNSSSSPCCVSAAPKADFFPDRLSSLELNVVCFVSNEAFIVSNSFCLVAMKPAWASTAAASAALADSRFESNVSFICLRMPTTAPDCEV